MNEAIFSQIRLRSCICLWARVRLGDLCITVQKHFKRDLSLFAVVCLAQHTPGRRIARAGGWLSGVGAGSVGMVAWLRDKSVVDR